MVSALLFGLISIVVIASRFHQRLVELALGLGDSLIRTRVAFASPGIIGADLFRPSADVCRVLRLSDYDGLDNASII